jgi:hypothetical protein
VLSVIRMRDELRRIAQRGRQKGDGSLGFLSRMGSRLETLVAHNTDLWCVRALELLP